MCLQPTAEQQSTLQPVQMDPVIEKKYKDNFHALVSQSILSLLQPSAFLEQKHWNELPCVQVYGILGDTVDKMTVMLQQTR